MIFSCKTFSALSYHLCSKLTKFLTDQLLAIKQLS